MRGGEMGEYRRKPVHVEARQFTSENAAELAAWTNGEVYQRYLFGKPQTLVLAIKVSDSRGVTNYDMEGRFIEATEGEWVIFEEGRFVVLMDEQFRREYEDWSH